MPGLALQRCFHHEDREAVSRCPNCGRYFCRECVSPHEGRLLCSPCILSLAEQTEALQDVSGQRQRILRAVGQPIGAVLTLVLIWLIFYIVGWIIVQLRPTTGGAALGLAPLTAEARVI